MNFLTFWKKSKVFSRRHKHEKPLISLLIPFSTDDPLREKSFKWLMEYWKCELPEAEIVIGKSKGKIFCKGEALNNAVKKSKGRVLVILDADAYLSGDVIRKCAHKIVNNLDNHLWYVPYRHLYRLTKDVTDIILDSDPCNPIRPPEHPPECFYENTKDKSRYGHRYGAMIMMFPREAYEALGCFDERFRGWGGEDIALLRALDTIYGKHKTTKNSIFHMWHPFIGDNYKTRMWKGQNAPNSNDKLAMKYHQATNHPTKMRHLVDEGCKHRKKFLYL